LLRLRRQPKVSGVWSNVIVRAFVIQTFPLPSVCGSGLVLLRPDINRPAIFACQIGRGLDNVLLNGGYGGEEVLFFTRFNLFSWLRNCHLNQRRWPGVAKNSAPDSGASS